MITDEVLEIDENGKVHGPIMQFIGGDWLFTDCFGVVWRLIQTGLPDMPLTITIEKKND